MMPRENKMKRKMKAGEVVIGAVVPGYWPELVEICGHLGYDFVQIDMEHGAITMDQAANLVRAAESGDITPLGRVPHNAPDWIMRFLDAGMQGVIVPHVSSKADAEAIVQAAYYHPYGHRGIGGTRTSGYGARMNIQEMVEYTNNETVIVALLEDMEGVRNLDEILSIPQIDAMAIGHTDLSNSLGVPGDIYGPEVTAVMDECREKIRNSHVVLGLGATSADIARMRIEEQGAGYIIVQLSQLFINGARDMLTGVRDAVAG